jgi:uncharacterized protein YndB with AHSA1/START domain
VFPVPPDELYQAWLDGERHGAFTGGAASVEAQIGGRHTAWDGYIEGEVLELEEGRRIVQSWRSLDFPVDAPHSRLELVLEPTVDGGTEVVLTHSEIPEGQGADYEEGWVEHYFKPMQRYFRGEPVLLIENDPEPDAYATMQERSAPKKAPAKKAAAKTAVKAAAHAKKAAPKKAAPKKAAPKKAAPKKAATKAAAKKGAKKAAPKKAAKKTKPKKVAKKAAPKKAPAKASKKKGKKR